jgi:hypothetical protein
MTILASGTRAWTFRAARANIRIYGYEEAWRQPARLLADLFEFLNVDAAFRVDTSRKRLERRAPRLVALSCFLKRHEIWYPLRSLVPPRLRPALSKLAFRRGNPLAMEPADRQYLIDYYREDIQRLASLLDRDLSAWLRRG